MEENEGLGGFLLQAIEPEDETEVLDESEVENEI